MRLRALALHDGWPLALAAVVGAAVTAVLMATSASSLEWLAWRLAAFGFAFVVLGLVVGSDHLVGLASVLVLGGALAGSDGSSGPAWGRTMLIGCLWYLTLELAWAAIEQRDDTVRAPAVGRQRVQEVATVVAVAVVVGLGGAAAASVAPTRTLLLRGSVVAVVLLALLAGVRQLVTTAPNPGARESAGPG